ncbi:MAG: hypothetical protein ACOYLK_09460 [Sphingomonas sp.]
MNLNVRFLRIPIEAGQQTGTIEDIVVYHSHLDPGLRVLPGSVAWPLATAFHRAQAFNGSSAKHVHLDSGPSAFGIANDKTERQQLPLSQLRFKFHGEGSRLSA